MKIKVIRGGEPLQLFEYLLDPKKQLSTQPAVDADSIKHLIICQSVPGRTVLDLARNFRQVAKLNARVTKTVAHYSLSLPVEDNDRINRALMYQLSRTLLERLGHARCPYFGVEHHDTKHRHWHLAASTVAYDGEWVDDSFERYRLRQVERELEIDFKLKRSQIRTPVAIKNLSTGEYRLKKRSKKLLPKEKLWQALDAYLPVSKSLARLVMELRVNYPDISIQLTEKQGQHVGISFKVDGVAFAGRRLGRAYSLSGLKRYHNIAHDDKSKALLDEILSLSDAECRALYDEMEREQMPPGELGEVHQIQQ